ncbi:YbjN domain-containing protein [Skermania piniformis]|uniref:YbjN domain-containing protein n=1 Tax=Skermania pinensis TaxID=39122 RepID=A0ABX8SBL1_9ACTN|nr:YbjN domain-containing protein [Skermania piniformis]QXQ14372.1 YbjN domain-containing protein [Skermania piniformis]
MTADLTATADLIAGALAERELEFRHPSPTEFVIDLPGEHKLKTTCLLTLGPHGARVEAFVCRHPDENLAGVHRYLLRRNRRLYGVAYTIDRIGDIYLIGRISADALTADELDRVLGQVVEASDGDFNTLLELGFAESIRREWRWRVSRGESLANLAAFEHLVVGDQDRGDQEPGRAAPPVAEQPE